MARRPPKRDSSKTDANFTSEIRRKLDRAREVLDRSVPDTFLGRKTQDPFPTEDDGTASS